MKCQHDIISLGAGVQSTTLMLMAKHGELKYMPQAAIFADTQCESPKVYAHLDWLQNEVKNVIPIIKTTIGNLYTNGLNADINRFSNMPLFVYNKDGKIGMIKRECTKWYKIMPIQREIRKLIGTNHHRNKVRQWLGITTDEMIRMNINKTKYIRNYYPFVEEKPLSRFDCVAWLIKNGYPVPPKSSCIICPYHSDAYWAELKTNEPEQFLLACLFDEGIRHKLPKLKSPAFLHRSMKPLRNVQFNSQILMQFENLECSGNCFL